MLHAYGTWPSPISPRTVSSQLRLNNVFWDTRSETLVWSIGRGTLMAQRGIDAPRQLADDRFSARGRVGYGGGGFTVADGVVYAAGDRISKIDLQGGTPKPITPAYGGVASPVVSEDGAWVAYVHTYDGHDSLGIVDADGKHWPRRLFAGSDFVMQPAWRPAGDRIAFITWDQPQMPWDGTVLHLAVLKTDETGMPYIAEDQILAGDANTSVFQPMFSPDGRYLAYLSDETGWGQLYLHDFASGNRCQLTQGEYEHSTPAWIQGMRMFDWSPDSQSIYFLRNTAGFFSLHHIDVATKTEQSVIGLDDYTYLQQITVSNTGKIALIAEASTITPRVISLDPEDGTVRVNQRASTEHIAAESLSDAQAISWRGDDDTDIHGIYYPPVQRGDVPEGAPPLVVIIHGGPTSQTTAGYEKDAQFFATRGYAVLYVNHRGSTGYGRPYMKMLEGNWGVVDVEDAVSGAQYLVDAGQADPERLIIMGGSAGGYTVLQALVEKPGFFAAGICRYGISNQFMLVQTTHKFEARYNDRLLGTLPADTDTYRARSPLFHADNIVDPVIVFQGSDDEVVPKAQSDAIIDALAARGVPHEYYVYEGEGHGFRQPQNVQDYYERILAFLDRYVIYA